MSFMLTGWTSLKKEKIKLAFSPNLCYTTSMKDKPTPFFVLFGQQRADAPEVCFGGAWRRERCERIMRNPFAKIVEGTGRIVEFPSREAAWEAHGESLDIAHGRTRI